MSGNLAPHSQCNTLSNTLNVWKLTLFTVALSLSVWTLCLRAYRRVVCKVWYLAVPALLTDTYQTWWHATGSDPRTSTSTAWFLPCNGEKSDLPELPYNFESSGPLRQSKIPCQVKFYSVTDIQTAEYKRRYYVNIYCRNNNTLTQHYEQPSSVAALSNNHAAYVNGTPVRIKPHWLHSTAGTTSF
jgi:hypothetical protein